ncbi:hypothetical protein D915_004202 [Fasciola hepatica]|uniref:Uncharacterized protein n=1 Tax=Fasciola hepatica TaxID=6192 RepID=A0A4E0RCI9_FASHE|nr:hypothetical protein D915_004202 [Fasciola hepatica]
MNKTEATQAVVHTTAHHSAPTSASELDYSGDFRVASDAGFPKKQITSPSAHLSSPRSVLSTARNCHLTPLSVTWNPPVLYSKGCDEHWVPGSGSNGDSSVLDSTVVQSRRSSEERSNPASGLPLPSKAAPCHQFSVAALTDEPSRSSPNQHSPVESSLSPVKSMANSVNRRPAQHGSRNGARTSVLHSPVPPAEEVSYVHSLSPNFLPTAPRSGSTSPFSHTQPHICQTQHIPDKLLSASSYLNNQCTPNVNRLSDGHSGTSRATGTHHRVDIPQTFSGSSKLSPTLPSLPVRRPSPGSTVKSDPSKLHRPVPAAPTFSQQRPTHLNAGTVPGTSHVSVPDLRLLQQMLGVDLNMATQLLSDPRFRDLYSLTMANLTSNEKKPNTGVSSIGSSSSTRPNPAESRVTESEVPTSVASSLNALVKLASTDMVSPSSMDMLLRLRSVPEPNQIGPLGPRCAPPNQPGIRNPSNVLHSAYHDRELLNRIPVSSESATQTQPAQPPPPLPLHHGNPNATGMKVLPPPPPLTAGHSTDNDPSTSNHIRSRYPTVPPPPMLSGANALPVSRSMPNTFGRAPGPVGFTGSNPHGSEAVVKSHSDNLSQPTGVSGISRIPPSQPQPPPPLSYPPVSSNSFGRPPIQPPPLPPPYNLNPMFNPQTLQPSVGPVPATGTGVLNATKHPAHLPPNPGSLLHHKAHPDKSYGRWADAHVRAARFIHLCQSLRPGQLPRNDRRRNSSCTGQSLPHTVVRPVARRDQPHSSGSRPILNPTMGPLSSRLQSPQMLTAPRQWDSLTYSHPHPRPPISQHPIPPAPIISSGTTVNPSTAELDKNPFWNYIMNSVMSNLSPADLPPSHSASGSEAMDAFWTSVFQRLTRNDNNAGGNTHINTDNHIVRRGNSNANGKQHPSQPHPCLTRSVPGQSAPSSDSDHIPQHGPRYALSSSSMFSHSLNPPHHGPHSSLPVHLPASGGRFGLESKRPRLEPGTAHCDQVHQTPFPLVSRFPHPNTLPIDALQQTNQDVIHAATRLLNGFHARPSVSASENMIHQTTSATNELRGTESLEKNRLKMGSMTANLAPVHRW